MYENYWSLKEKPFENTPDPRFMYYSNKHEEALTRLLYGIKEQKGAVMLTGECGSGKTVLSRIVIDELVENKDYEAALITHPQLTPIQFIQEIIYQLKNEYHKGSKPRLIHELQDTVYEYFRLGKKTVIMIDEAQAIKNKATLEELRMLLNFQLNDKFLITLVLLGQPELLSAISTLPQLQQRLGIRYHLTALDEADVEKYIFHRLEISGRKERIFEEEAIGAIYRYSGGVPRNINNICDMSLLIGCVQKLTSIGRQLIGRVASDLKTGEELSHAEVF